MQRLAVLILLAAGLAGCSTGSDDAPADFVVRILYDERSTFYTGDDVQLEAVAAGDVVSWQWDLGDGASADGRVVRHVYQVAGQMHVRVEATRADGASGHGEATLTIRDLFGTAPGTPPPASEPASPSSPPPDEAPQGSGIVSLGLADGEPTTGEPFALRIDGPSFFEGGTVTVWLEGEPRRHEVGELPDTLEGSPLPAGRQEVPWMAELDGEVFHGRLVFDVWGLPIDFQEPTAGQWLRPGVQSVAGGAQCTTNFLFHYKWYRFFIGSAAHCVDDTDINEVCSTGPTAKLGSSQTVRAHDGRSVKTSLAYSSWITLDEKGGGGCPANDFALYELDAKGQAVMHPKALFFGGPTKMAPMGGYSTGTLLHGYGASQLHGNAGVAYPGQDTVNSKRGLSLGVTGGGYYQQMYFAIPGVPGDSGGPAFGPGGEALGAASVIYYAPFAGSNSYTIIPKALAYMEEHEGWAPELVTYDDWAATGA